MLELIELLLQKEWEFEMIRDEYDDYCMHIILSNQEYFIYNDNDAKEIFDDIMSYYDI